MPDPHAWDHWTIDSFNAAVLGRTQTGKTSTARELHAETPRLSIWVNEQGDGRVPNVASDGQPVRSIEGIKQAFARDQWAINLLSADRERDIPALQSYLWQVADRADRQFPMQVVIDEVHRPAPQSQQDDLPARDAIRRLAKEGNKRNIKTVLVTQDPVSMDKQTLRQSEYRVVFEMSAEQRDAVSQYGFEWDAVESGDRFTGAVHDASGRVLEDQVKADGKYA
jgi:hypothetical protein